MKQETTKKFYVLHSWIGVLAANLMFVICFTGAVSVFGKDELKIWANPIMHEPLNVDIERLEAVIQKDFETLDPSYGKEVSIFMPGVRRTGYVSARFQKEWEDENGTIQNHVINLEYDPRSLELVNRVEGDRNEVFAMDRTDMSDFITHFHADLHLGNPVGLLITGTLGLTLLASLATGLFVHRKILKEMFVFRPFRSLHLLWTDTHKALGIWPLLFHINIAFTGAFLGLAVVILFPATAYVTFDGDLDKVVETILPEPKPVLTGEATPIEITNHYNQVQSLTDGDVVQIILFAAGDSGSEVVVITRPDQNMVGSFYSFNATGDTLKEEYTTFGRMGGAAGPVLETLFPLHFGNFGGLFVRCLWAVLGLASGVLALSGMMIWIERRAYGPVGNLSKGQYEKISRFSVSFCGGMVLANISLFYSQLLLSVPDQALGYWIGVVFFATWAVASVYGFFVRNEYKLAKQLFYCAALGCAFIPVLNGLVHGLHVLNVFEYKHYVAAGVDLTLLLCGLLFAYLGKKLPEERPGHKQSTTEELNAVLAG